MVKYCSDKCKAKKPSTNPESLDVRLEQALLSLLLGDETNDAAAQASKASNKKRKAKKGDRRILVSISDLENAVFGDRHDPEKVYGRNKNRYRRGVADEPDWKSVDMQNGVDKNGSAERLKGAEHGGHVEAPPHDEEDDSSDVSVEEQKLIGDEGVPLPADHIRPSQHQSAVNFSVGGERGWGERIDETPEMLQRRREGQQRADEKELAKNVARRAVVFGLEVPATRSKGVEEGKVDRRYCEVILKGGTDAVEPSFAKVSIWCCDCEHWCGRLTCTGGLDCAMARGECCWIVITSMRM